MNVFKPGDIIKGKPKNGYGVTTDKAIMEVMESYTESGKPRLKVEVIRHLDNVGSGNYTVDAEKFVLYKGVSKHKDTSKPIKVIL